MSKENPHRARDDGDGPDVVLGNKTPFPAYMSEQAIEAAGVLDYLEGFSYDEPWPASIGTFVLSIPATGGGRPLSLQSTRP